MNRPLTIGAAIGALLLLLPRKALGYINGKPVEIDLKSIGGGLYLEASAADAYLKMRAAAAADGVQLVPSGPRSAFRSTADQAELNVSRAEFAAPVGYSNHQAGRAIDLETNVGSNAAYRWLVSNAHRFRFYATVQREPWHWEHKR